MDSKSQGQTIDVVIGGEQLVLLPEKACWLPQHQALLLADLHLGKVNHFRKSGIAVPAAANDRNTEALIQLLRQWQPARCIFLGDLFHSHYNEEWEVMGQVSGHFAACQFELVLGNHDILSPVQYDRHRIRVHRESLQVGKLLLTHHPVEEHTGGYNLAGHLHPGLPLRGKARQSLTLPCFYFGPRGGLLPAFGAFTGLARIRPEPESRVFVVADGKVLDVSQPREYA